MIPSLGAQPDALSNHDGWQAPPGARAPGPAVGWPQSESQYPFLDPPELGGRCGAKLFTQSLA
jgi:hypothetical protein